MGVLENHRGNFVSGQALADEIGVSRMAIWKSIEALRKEGYRIESLPSKGYKLQEGNDILSEEGIRSHLPKKYKQNPVIVYDTIDSTNNAAKTMAMQGAEHGTLIVANEQKQGRGRFGRTFFSPKSKGVFLSIVLRPQMLIQETVFTTILAAIATVRMLGKITEEEIRIKWVNDIFVQDKKVGGILTELACDVESQQVSYIVVGIGLNVNMSAEDFPPEISELAGSIRSKDFSRNYMAAELLNQVLSIFEEHSAEAILEEYRSKQYLLGKDVFFEKDNQKMYGKALDIDAKGALVVRVGEEDVTLNSGEVSVRLQ